MVLENKSVSKYTDETLSDRVDDNRRDSKHNSLFYLWFGSNLTVADFALGVLVEYYGLTIFYTIIALLIANIFGGLLVGIMSYLGPSTGMGQMEISKKSFGSKGGRVFSSLQFLNTIGWLSVNLIISARALQFILSYKDSFTPNIDGVSIIEIISLAIVMILIAMTIIYGHKSIKSFEKVMSYVLGFLFLVLAISLVLGGSQVISIYNGNFNLIAFASVIMLSFSYIMSWGPYAADYSRYMPTGRKSSFKALMYTFVGSALASFLVELIGFFIGIDLSLSGVFSNDLFIALLGSFWVLGSITLFLGGLSANALNIYSNLMSIRSLGFKNSRKLIMLLIGILTIFLGYLFYNNFSTYYEGFLYVLDYWITPWLGVMIAEFFIVKRKYAFSGKLNWSPLMAYLLSIVISIPFMDTIQYYFNISIPFYNLTGGVDLSYIVSFFSAMFLTYLFEKFFEKKVAENTNAEILITT
jgi:NCS1 family nucleobase:cation symporter-1